MQLYLKERFLTCKLFGTVILGEGNVYVELVADVLSDNLILKAGDKLTGSEYERMALSLSAVKSLAVSKALEINYNGIAVCRRAVFYRYHAGVALRHGVYFGVYFRRVNLYGCLFSLKALVFTHFYFGIGCYRNFEIDTVIFGNGDKVKIHFVVYYLKTRLGNSLINKIIVKQIESVLKENLGAVICLDNMERRLAFSEAGNVYFLSVLFVRFLYRLAEFFTVNGDFKLVPVSINLFCFFQAHFYTSVQ